MEFKKAVKTQAKLRATFDGPAGSGKTFSSLQLATQLAAGGKIALIDTERGSASKYADLYSFDTLELPEFSLETYVKAINAAAQAGYPVLVIDSISHAWNGKGGALEVVDRLSASGESKFSKGWRQVTPIQTRFIDTILGYPGHVICTMRSKMEYVLEDVNGKKVPRKVGMAPVQREGVEYEFDVVVDLSGDGGLVVSKSRCLAVPSGLTGNRIDLPEIGAKLAAWLSDGAEAPKQPITVEIAAQPTSASAGADKFLAMTAMINQAETIEHLRRVGLEIAKIPPTERELLRGAYEQREKSLKRAS